MAITAIGAVSQPTDNSSAAGPTQTITPVGSMVAGDLVVLAAQSKDNLTLSILATGGQTWTSEASFSSTNVNGRIFWCRFNGTWSANPSVTNTTGTLALTLLMAVFRPTDSAKLWGVDVAQATNAFAAPTTPFTVTITGITTSNASTVSMGFFMSTDDNTWGTITGSGWNDAGFVRNLQGTDQSMEIVYQLKTSAGATNNVSANQATLGGDNGITAIMAWYEYDAGGAITPKNLSALGVG